MGCHFLHQGIFPIQGMNLRLWLDRQILYHWPWEGGKPPAYETALYKGKKKRAQCLLLHPHHWPHAPPSPATLFKKDLKCIHIAAIPYPLHSYKLCFPHSNLLSNLFPSLTLSHDNGLASSYIPNIKGIRQNSLNSLLQNPQDLSSHHFCNLTEPSQNRPTPSLPCPPPASYL